MKDRLIEELLFLKVVLPTLVVIALAIIWWATSRPHPPTVSRVAGVVFVTDLLLTGTVLRRMYRLLDHRTQP